MVYYLYLMKPRNIIPPEIEHVHYYKFATIPLCLLHHIQTRTVYISHFSTIKQRALLSCHSGIFRVQYLSTFRQHGIDVIDHRRGILVHLLVHAVGKSQRPVVRRLRGRLVPQRRPLHRRPPGGAVAAAGLVAPMATPAALAPDARLIAPAQQRRDELLVGR